MLPTRVRSARAQTTPRPGRPRSGAADRAILSATLHMLDEAGFEALTMEGVAARSGVAKTTIYRRWASKEDLVIAALQHLQAQVAPLVETDSLRQTFLQLARALQRPEARFLTERIGLRLFMEAPSDSALFAGLRDHLAKARLRPATRMVREAQARGEIRQDVDPMLLFDVFAGALLFHMEVTERLAKTPPRYAERLIDLVWRGVGTTEPD